MPDFHSAYDGKFIPGGSGGSSPRNSRAGRGKRRFDDDDPTTAKRVRERRALPSIEQFDATDGLPEGDRWSTWDQSKNLVSNGMPARHGVSDATSDDAQPVPEAKLKAARRP